MQAPTTRPLTTFEPETGAMTPVTLQTRDLHGGRLTAGPVSGGGFGVRFKLPTSDGVL